MFTLGIFKFGNRILFYPGSGPPDSKDNGMIFFFTGNITPIFSDMNDKTVANLNALCY